MEHAKTIEGMAPGRSGMNVASSEVGLTLDLPPGKDHLRL
jgi:hypothetical protein